MIKCPTCNEQVISSKARNSAILYYCAKCESLYYFNHKREDLIKIGYKDQMEEIPPLIEGTNILVANKEHELFLESGLIVQRSHKFYRVKFYSFDKLIDDKIIWLPAHWVVKFPELEDKT